MSEQDLAKEATDKYLKWYLIQLKEKPDYAVSWLRELLLYGSPGFKFMTEDELLETMKDLEVERWQIKD